MSSGVAQAASDAVNAVAKRYAHLVLALGQHDPDHVDAFYVEGARTEKEKKSLDAIGAEAAEPIAILGKNREEQGRTGKNREEQGRTGKNRVKSQHLTFRLALQTTRRKHRKVLTSPTTVFEYSGTSNYRYETNYFGCHGAHGSVRIGDVGLRQKDIRRPQTEGGGNEANCRKQSERGKGSCRQTD
jgi:hypothetical protein